MRSSLDSLKNLFEMRDDPVIFSNGLLRKVLRENQRLIQEQHLCDFGCMFSERSKTYIRVQMKSRPMYPFWQNLHYQFGWIKGQELRGVLRSRSS